MNCLECHELIQRYLDGEPAATDRDDWTAHLVICLECSEQYAAAQCLLDGLRLLPVGRPPASLLQKICQQIVWKSVSAARLRRLLVTSAMAASLLLLGSAVYLRSRVVSIAKTRAESSRLEQPQPPTASLSLHRRIEEAGLAVVALTRRTADETMGQTKLLIPPSIPEAAIGDVPRLEQALEGPAQSFWEIQQGMSAGLEPVATAARRAVDFFLREIPTVESSMQ